MSEASGDGKVGPGLGHLLAAVGSADNRNMGRFQCRKPSGRCSGCTSARSEVASLVGESNS
jgi:hypothetical protein